MYLYMYAIMHAYRQTSKQTGIHKETKNNAMIYGNRFVDLKNRCKLYTVTGQQYIISAFAFITEQFFKNYKTGYENIENCKNSLIWKIIYCCIFMKKKF